MTEESQRQHPFIPMRTSLDRRVVFRRLLVLVGISVVFNAAWGSEWLGGSTFGWMLLLSGFVADMVIRSRLSFVLVPIAFLLPVSINILVVSPLLEVSWPNPYWIGYLIGMTIIFSIASSIGVGCSMLFRVTVPRVWRWVNVEEDRVLP